jgi:hypothetical protein
LDDAAAAEEERRAEEAGRVAELPPEVTDRVPLEATERVRAAVEGARETLEERRDPTTEERVEAPVRAEEPLRTPEDLVARDTLLREAVELRAKLLWEAPPRAEKLPSR